jgi:hypothetical protein
MTAMGNMNIRSFEFRRHLVLARHLDRTAALIERGGAGGDGFITEDAAAVLRWSAAYLRRPMMRDDDLEGALAVFRRLLPDFDFSPPGGRVVAAMPRPRRSARR